MKREESFGVIPLSKKGQEWEVFLIQHHRSGYWGFPKGRRETGETALEAAFRELKEETNLELVRFITEESLEEQYSFIFERKKVHKKVAYFVAEVDGKIELQKQEIHDGKWIPLSLAGAHVTHKEGKTLLIEVEKILKDKNLL